MKITITIDSEQLAPPLNERHQVSTDYFEATDELARARLDLAAERERVKVLEQMQPGAVNKELTRDVERLGRLLDERDGSLNGYRNSMETANRQLDSYRSSIEALQNERDDLATKLLSTEAEATRTIEGLREQVETSKRFHVDADAVEQIADLRVKVEQHEAHRKATLGERDRCGERLQTALAQLAEAQHEVEAARKLHHEGGGTSLYVRRIERAIEIASVSQTPVCVDVVAVLKGERS